VRIAVAQHTVRFAPAQDLEALVLFAAQARAEHAEVVFLPSVAAIDEGPLSEDLWRRLEEDAPGITVLSAHTGLDEGDGWVLIETPLGMTAFVAGDACFDADMLEVLASQSPAVTILAPASESEIQAEATLELAVGLSLSLSALVIVVEPDGAAPGEAGHGGSAIVHLGEVIAEAINADDLLVVDIDVPVGTPEPRQALPEVPPLLLQRIAVHHGEKLPVDYPADLS